MTNLVETNPPLPTPEPLRGKEAGSFAHYSIVVRLVDIARRTLAENDFPAGTVARLEGLIGEIPGTPLRLLQDPEAPDEQAWNTYLAPYQGLNWLEVPWFLAETYFFRRILEATRYFQPGPGFQADPYHQQKRLGLEIAADAVTALAERLNTWLGSGLGPGADPEETLVELLYTDLWSNQADLSLWPAEGPDKPDHADLEQASAFLLADDALKAARFLLDRNPPAGRTRVDFIIDNAGFELVVDLCLADFLLSHPALRKAEKVQVYLNVKPQPTFVSDAIFQDPYETTAYLANSSQPGPAALGRRLNDHLQQGRLRLKTDGFWTSPLPMWEMPPALLADLSGADLVISKGDANYRRLLGDRHWPLDMPFAEIVRYFPPALLALRALKSEVACGLPAEKEAAAARQDPDWLISGRWGLIQFAPARTSVPKNWSGQT